MARIRGPLLSAEARGKFGNSIIFQEGHSGFIARNMFKPKNKKTAFQQSNRSNITFGVNIWQSLSDFTKLIWEFVKDKKHLSMSGYNFFLSEYNISRNTGQPTKLYPDMNLFEDYPIPNGLISWWKFDEDIGNTAKDYIGINDGIIDGGDHVDGKINKAIRLYGAPTKVNCGNDTSLNLASTGHSFCLWAKGFSDSEFSSLFCKTDFATGGYSLRIDDAGIITFSEFSSTAEILAITPINNFYDYEWHNIIITVNTITKKGIMYVDGVKVAENTYIGDFANSSNNLTIGYNSIDVEGFSGIIDEVMIYNRALTKDEVLHNYNRK